MRRGGPERLDPPKKVAPSVLFFNIQSSFSKLVHLLVKKFSVLESSGASKVMINIQKGIL